MRRHVSEEVAAVLPGVGGDAAQRTLVEQVVLVVEGRHVGQVDPGDRQGATTVQCGQCYRDEVADWREQDRRVEGLGRLVVRVRSGRSAKLEGQASRGLRPGQHMNPGALGDGDLRGEMGRCAEAVNAQAAAHRQLGPMQGPPADDAGAQQGRQLRVRANVRQMVREVGGHGGELRITAVGVPPRVA
jgi:hypothetical protein